MNKPHKIQLGKIQEEQGPIPIGQIETEKIPEDQVEKSEDKKDTTLLIAIGVLIALFAIALIGVRFLKGPTGAMTLEQMHELNIQGKETVNNYLYNGYSFVNNQGLWYTQVENHKGTLFDIPLHYGPRELEDISIVGSISDEFLTQDLYLTFDPTGTELQYVALSSAELSLSLASGFGLTPNAVCMNNDSRACADRKIISECQTDKAVIILRKSNVTKVAINGNCVVIEGIGEDLVRATDRFLLRLYSIMD